MDQPPNVSVSHGPPESPGATCISRAVGDGVPSLLKKESFGLSKSTASCPFLVLWRVENIGSRREAASSLDNRFIVDLAVQIAVSQEDESLARARLALLQAIDAPEFYLHRASNVELTFGNTRGLGGRPVGG